MKRRHIPPSKYLLLISALTLLGAAAVDAASYSATVLADKPIAYWRLEETEGAGFAFDSSATGWYPGFYNCTQSGTYTPKLGQVGIETNSVLFHPTTVEGTTYNSYINVPYSPDLNPPGPSPQNPSGPFSVEAWVRAISASDTAYRVPVGSYNHNNGNEGWFFYQTPGPGGVGSSWVWVQRFGGIWLGGGAVNMFQWQHLAASFDGTNVSFYVDGQYQGQSNAYDVAPNSASDLIIGAMNPSGGYFDGNVDEVAVYTNALSAVQIATHYQVGLTNFRTGNLPPDITANPQSVTAYAGHPVKFTVSADGTRPFSYQWFKGTTPLTSQTNEALSFTCSLADNGASYKVQISNDSGSVESTAGTLTVLTNLILKASPVSITRTEGSKAAFRAPSEGAWPISYQWYKGSNPLAGATNETLWLSKIQLAEDSSTYYAKVTNPFRTTNSETATLNVVARTFIVPLNRYGKVVAADDPVAYWRLDQPDMSYPAVDAVGSFDGIFEDASGAGTGVFSFGAASGIPHETNTAVSVTGGAWVKVPYALELNPYGPFSLEAWVKPSSLAANDTDYRSVLGTLGNGVGGPIGWHIYQLPSHEFILAVWGDNWINTWLYTGKTLVANDWYHLVVSYDGSLFRMYINGVRYIEEGWNGFIQNDDGAFVFGWRTDKDWKPFSGVIDDVAFYNKVLAPSQVEDHFAASVRLTMTKVDNKVVLSWPLGTLQQAATVNGTYNDLGTITSPYTNAPGSTPAFFRVKAY